MRILLLLITFLIVQCKPEEKIIIPKKPALAMKAKSKLPPADLDYIMGKFDPAQREDFIKIPREYTDRDGLYLRKRALDSFEKMRTAAAEKGISSMLLIMHILNQERVRSYTLGCSLMLQIMVGVNLIHRMVRIVHTDTSKRALIKLVGKLFIEVFRLYAILD